MSPRHARRGADGATPSGFHREIVASFSSYTEAERALQSLDGNRFPVDRVSIVAQGLRVDSKEQPTAWLANAVEAATAGGTVGALAALLAWLAGFWADPWLPLAVGAGGGVLGGLAAEQVSLGRRGPGTEVRLSAERYDLSTDPRIADTIAEAIDSASWSL